jgi:hypothetical protein
MEMVDSRRAALAVLIGALSVGCGAKACGRSGQPAAGDPGGAAAPVAESTPGHIALPTPEPVVEEASTTPPSITPLPPSQAIDDTPAPGFSPTPRPSAPPVY